MRFGTESDLDQLYLRHVGPIRNYLHHLSGNHQLAEDLVQEVFYRAMRQFMLGARVRHVAAWLYRIARNLYLDSVKRRRLEETSLDALGDQARSSLGQPEVEALRRETSAGISVALRTLPERQRTALFLRDVEGLSYREIAEVLGTNPGAVKSLLHRARKGFIDIYTRLEAGDEAPTGGKPSA